MTEEFEKWFADEFGTCPQPNDASWAEWEHTKNRSRYAWQASRKQALEEIVSTLQMGGATLPAPPPDGTPESCVRAGMCMALECTCPSGDGSLRPCPVHPFVVVMTSTSPKARRYEWQKRDGEWHLVLVEVEVHTPSATITVEVSEEREVGE